MIFETISPQNSIDDESIKNNESIIESNPGLSNTHMNETPNLSQNINTFNSSFVIFTFSSFSSLF